VIAIRDIHKVGGDAYPLSRAPHTSFQQRFHVQLSSDFPNIYPPPKKRKAEVLEATCNPSSRASALVRSSDRPSLKY
jgi:hypothetical protein